MKKIIFLLFVVASITLQLQAQESTTIILIRHAEKDTSVKGSNAMVADPPLSEVGKLRAERMVQIFAEYNLDFIYATNYTRTKSTVTPLANKWGKEIKLYDPKDLQSLADELLLLKGKTIVVVGHSNTTPALVNLLIKQNSFDAMPDNEYSKYWIVTVKDGQVKAFTKAY